MLSACLFFPFPFSVSSLSATNVTFLLLVTNVTFWAAITLFFFVGTDEEEEEVVDFDEEVDGKHEVDGMGNYGAAVEEEVDGAVDEGGRWKGTAVEGLEEEPGLPEKAMILCRQH